MTGVQNESYVDYEKIYILQISALRKAFENYDCETDQSTEVCKRKCCLAGRLQPVYGNQGQTEWISWIEWLTEPKNREKLLAEEREKLAKRSGFLLLPAVLLFKQWTALESLCKC